MPSMRKCVIFWILCPACLCGGGGVAAQSCEQLAVSSSARTVKELQSNLLAYRLQDEMDEEVPVSLQSKIGGFKGALAAFADSLLECADTNPDPDKLESTMARLLDANKPGPPQQVYDASKPSQLDRIYGDSLAVKVTSPANVPHLIFVEFTFGIACGEDSILLAYELRSNHWHRTLRWQSGGYNEVSGAFGDFFKYVVLPQSGSGSWLLAVAHGHPWCTSNLSAFDIDILEPSTGNSAQKTLFHENLGYRRDENPVMKPVSGGFQLRMLTTSIDPAIVMRAVIYRFDVARDVIQRVQPIANNGRDFVDEWLQATWSDAASWSAPPNLAQLKREYSRIAALRDPDAKDWPLLTFGPVRGCSDSPVHFQVELDEEWVGNKGDSRPARSTYFQVQQGKNSFTMQGASAVSDSYCTGPDIMPRH